MNSQILKLVLLTSLIFSAGCDLTLKRKAQKSSDAQAETSEQKDTLHKNSGLTEKDKKKSFSSEVVFSENDSSIITSFYSDKANAVIRDNMIRHTSVSQKQQKKLVVGKVIPRDFQVLPLPLRLERALSTLELHFLRVQVGANVVLMNVKSRLILDIIKI